MLTYVFYSIKKTIGFLEKTKAIQNKKKIQFFFSENLNKVKNFDIVFI